jgi:putative DNA primase/helicase
VRFVGISETKPGVQLEKSVVKQITANDTISARAPYGKPFTYRPQFEIWMSTNHKPEIPDGSEAIWDRLKLIPFNQRFEGKRADADLPEKLREELPGVLAWAVMACVEWWQHGLGSAAAVEAATAAYRAETDVLDRFFDDACVFGPDERVSKKGLYEAWVDWCEEEGVNPETQTTFTKKVAERGGLKNFEEGKVGGIRVWKGLNVRSSAPNDPSPDKVPHEKSLQTGGKREFGALGSKFLKHFYRTPYTRGVSEKRAPSAPSAPRRCAPPAEWREGDLLISYGRGAK